MQLAQQTTEFIAWTRQVMAVLLQVRRWTTLGVIAAEATSDITRLLAFFLPLKVILLAGSDGVPRYFPFIDPAQKLPWIIGLGAGAFIFYGLTLALDALAERLSEGASGDVLEGANEMALNSNQHEQAQKAYAGFCRVCANGLFIVFGGLAITLLNPKLGAFLAVLVSLQYAMTAWMVAGADDARPGPVKAWVQGRLGTYVDINSSVAFLLGFVVILLPYLYGAGGNILIALLTVIAMRQLLGAITGIGKTAVRLTKQRERIDALIFHDQPQQKREKLHLRTLRDLFMKEARQQRGNAILAEALGHNPAADVAWSDSPRPFVTTLTIGPVSDQGEDRYFQQQVYAPPARVHLENEAFLFRHVERSRLHAPARLYRFEEYPFECQILDYGQGQNLKRRQWKALHQSLVTDILGCQPPARMVAAYRKSNPLMGERIDDRLFDRLAIAVDTDAEASALADLRAAAPRVRERLAALPLCIDNRDLVRETTAAGREDEPLVMIWGRWSLEPLGGTRLTQMHNVMVADILPRLAARRTDLPRELYSEDIELADLCRRLETHDQKARYKVALGIVPAILDNLATERTSRAA